ncbi:hypothetical protein GCM10008983_17460 [Lentibacillus halophilus]|uniref:Uncharacterized protein n=1 Tax=Lentibacillus halophilus TaxID=295065 RepID=A0ABN0ZA02_9BACI
MKNTNIGLILFLSGAIIYGAALIAASVYSQTLVGTDGQGWDGRYGVFGTALREMGIIPIVIAIVLGVIGIILIIPGTKWWQKQKKEINKRNREFEAEKNKEMKR